MQDNKKDAPEKSTDTLNTKTFNTISITHKKQEDNIKVIEKEIARLEGVLISYDKETIQIENDRYLSEMTRLSIEESKELKELEIMYRERRLDKALEIDYKYSKKQIKDKYKIYKRIFSNNILKFRKDRKLYRTKTEDELKRFKKQLNDLLDDKKVEREKQKTVEKVAKSLRWKSRFFSFVMYPESMPDNAFSALEFTGLPFVISPLHDKDKEKATGKLKKPHYHVIGVMEQAMKGGVIYQFIVDTLGKDCVNTVVEVKDLKGAYMYLSHDTEKAIQDGKYKYNRKEITYFNNFEENYGSLLKEFDAGSISVVLTNEIMKHKFKTLESMVDYYFNDDEALDDIGIDREDLLSLVKKHGYSWVSIMNRYYFDEVRELKKTIALLELDKLELEKKVAKLTEHIEELQNDTSD